MMIRSWKRALKALTLAPLLLGFLGWSIFIEGALERIRGRPSPILIEATALALNKAALCEKISPRYYEFIPLFLNPPGSPKFQFVPRKSTCLERMETSRGASNPWATDYVLIYGLSDKVRGSSLWKEKYAGALESFQKDYPHLREAALREGVETDLDTLVLREFAKTGELDQFWRGKWVTFEPNIASYFSPPASSSGGASLEPPAKSSPWLLLLKKMESYPGGNCESLSVEPDRSRCYVRQAVLDTVVYSERQSVCVKITDQDYRRECFEIIADLGDQVIPR